MTATDPTTVDRCGLGRPHDPHQIDLGRLGASECAGLTAEQHADHQRRIATATDPSTAPAQPATPGQALRWAAGTGDHYVDPADLHRWADELDAAPAVYRLPAEPPATVTELWTANGLHAARCAEHLGCWVLDPGSPLSHYSFMEMLTYDGPLSSVPPAGTEGDDG